MGIDIRLAIHLLLPEAQYGGGIEHNTEEEFDALRWEDDRPQPSWQDVLDAHEKLVPVFNIKQRLGDLDGVYSRDAEDRDTKIGFTPYSGSPQAKAKTEKTALRTQLEELEAE